MDGANFLRYEELILLAIGGKDEVYGLEISLDIELATEGILINHGSLYTYLKRLEKKGYVKSRIESDGESDRSGVRRKYYRITKSGRDVLDEISIIRDRLSNDWNLVKNNSQ